MGKFSRHNNNHPNHGYKSGPTTPVTYTSPTVNAYSNVSVHPHAGHVVPTSAPPVNIAGNYGDHQHHHQQHMMVHPVQQLTPFDCYLEDLCFHGLNSVVNREQEARAVEDERALEAAIQRAIGRFGQVITKDTCEKVKAWVGARRAETEGVNRGAEAVVSANPAQAAEGSETDNITPPSGSQEEGPQHVEEASPATESVTPTPAPASADTFNISASTISALPAPVVNAVQPSWGSPQPQVLPTYQPVAYHSYQQPAVVAYSHGYYGQQIPSAMPMVVSQMPVPQAHPLSPHHSISTMPTTYAAPQSQQAQVPGPVEVAKKRTREEPTRTLSPHRQRLNDAVDHILPYNWKTKDEAVAVIDELMKGMSSRPKYTCEIKEAGEKVKTTMQYFTLYPEECTSVTADCSADTKAAAYELAHATLSFLGRVRFPHLSQKEVDGVIHEALTDERSRGYYGYAASGYVAAYGKACKELCVIDEETFSKKKSTRREKEGKDRDRKASSKRTSSSSGKSSRRGRYSDGEDSYSDRSVSPSRKHIAASTSSGARRRDRESHNHVPHTHAPPTRPVGTFSRAAYVAPQPQMQEAAPQASFYHAPVPTQATVTTPLVPLAPQSAAASPAPSAFRGYVRPSQ